MYSTIKYSNAFFVTKCRGWLAPREFLSWPVTVLLLSLDRHGPCIYSNSTYIHNSSGSDLDCRGNA